MNLLVLVLTKNEEKAKLYNKISPVMNVAKVSVVNVTNFSNYARENKVPLYSVLFGEDLVPVIENADAVVSIIDGASGNISAEDIRVFENVVKMIRGESKTKPTYRVNAPDNLDLVTMGLARIIGEWKRKSKVSVATYV